MGRKAKIPDKTREEVRLAVIVQGKSQAQAAREFGVSEASVSRIVGEVSPVMMVELERQKREELAERFGDAAGAFLSDALDPAKRKNASTRDLVVSAGIATDKSLLLQGEPTERVEHVSPAELKQELLELLRELKRDGIDLRELLVMDGEFTVEEADAEIAALLEGPEDGGELQE